MSNFYENNETNENPISRENEILHGDLMYTLDKIRFWVTIIGIYVLGKIIIGLIILTTKITSVIKLLQIIENIIN